MKSCSIPSVYYSQSDVLRAIATLHVPGGYDVDLTYGSGAFWKEVAAPRYLFDVEPVPPAIFGDSRAIPLAAESVGSVVFDPPFLTYVRSREGNGKMALARRFGGYWRYEELAEHYRATLSDAARVLRKGGILVFKCQDIIHNHRMHCTHANVIEWSRNLFRLRDLFILAAKRRMPSPQAGKQRHARIYHSYFLVLERL